MHAERSQNRPPFIINMNEVAEEAHYLDHPTELYRTRRRLGKATGACRLGVNHSRLQPGQVCSRLHFHSIQEEFLLVINGQATLLHGNAEYELGPGDAVSLPPGGPPHQVRNDFDQECLLLEIGTRDEEDVISYPEDPAAGSTQRTTTPEKDSP